MLFYSVNALLLVLFIHAVSFHVECAHLKYEGPSHLKLTHKFSNLFHDETVENEGIIHIRHHERILAHDHLRIMRKFNRRQLGEGDNKNEKEVEDKKGMKKTVQDSSLSGGGNFPLYGSASEFGLYWTKVGLGNPVQEYNVMIDTGSHLLWVDCEPCYQCPGSSYITKLAPPYDPSESSGSDALDCSTTECLNAQSQVTDVYGCNDLNSDDTKCYYNVTYGDGSSTAGYILKDEFEFSALDGEKITSNIVLGCGNFQTGNLYKGGDTVDGLIGLAKSSMSIPSQLYQQNLSSNVFAHCLGGERDGGMLVFGKIMDANVSYTPIVSPDELYSVRAVGLLKDGESIPDITQASFSNSYRKDAIVDSGTTLAYLPDAVFSPWITLLMQEVKNFKVIPSKEVQGLTCWEYGKRTYSELSNFFPSFVLQFEGEADMNIRPSNYLILYLLDSGDKAACVGWRSSVQVGLGITLLGEIVLRDRLVIYDREFDQIGWLDHDCSNISVTVMGKPGSKPVTVEDSGVLSASASSSCSNYFAFFSYFCSLLILSLSLLTA